MSYYRILGPCLVSAADLSYRLPLISHHCGALKFEVSVYSIRCVL